MAESFDRSNFIATLFESIDPSTRPRRSEIMFAFLKLKYFCYSRGRGDLYRLVYSTF